MLSKISSEEDLAGLKIGELVGGRIPQYHVGIYAGEEAEKRGVCPNCGGPIDIAYPIIIHRKDEGTLLRERVIRPHHSERDYLSVIGTINQEDKRFAE